MAAEISTRLVWIRNRWPRKAIAVGIGTLLALVIAASVHEFTHQYVFATYGCESSIQWFPPHRNAIAITNPEAGCWSALSATERRELHLTHLMVEAVGYHVVPLYGLAGAIAGFRFATTSGGATRSSGPSSADGHPYRSREP